MEVRSSRRYSLWMRLALATVVAVLTVALVEGVLRICDWPPADPVWTTCRETAFKFAPNLDYQHMSPEYDVSFRTNSLGLRDDEIGPKRGYRILLLGDSYTCGYGVERSELFADLLEKQLQVDVINAGVGGFEIIHQLHYFRSQGRKFKPDLVVYALYLNNDLTGNRLWLSTPDGGLARRDGGPALEAKDSSKLLCLVKRPVCLRRMVHALRRDSEVQAEARPGEQYLALCCDPPESEAAEDYRQSLDLLRELRDEVVASGAEFLAVSFPLRAVVEDPSAEHYCPPNGSQATYDLLRPTRTMAELLASAGIEHVALTDLLRADRARLGEPLYFRADAHFNAVGHRCVAEHLAPILQERIGKSKDRSSSPRPLAGEGSFYSSLVASNASNALASLGQISSILVSPVTLKTSRISGAMPHSFRPIWSWRHCRSTRMICPIISDDMYSTPEKSRSSFRPPTACKTTSCSSLPSCWINAMSTILVWVKDATTTSSSW